MILLVGCIALLLLVLWVIKQQRSRAQLPPGFTPLPVFGNLLSLGALPHLTVSQFQYKRNTKICSVYFGNLLAIFISDPKLLQEAFITKWKNFSSRPGLPSIQNFIYAEERCTDLAFANGEMWRKYRRVCAPLFTKTKLKSYLSHITAELAEYDKQLSGLAKSGLPVDIHFFTNRFALNVIQRYAFGSNFSYNDSETNEVTAKLLVQIDTIFDLLGPAQYISDFIPFLSFLDTPKKRKMRTATDTVFEILSKEIAQHRSTLNPENPRDFLDDLLLEATKHSESKFFGEKDLLLICLNMYAAGTDTVGTSLEWFIHILAKYPEWQDKVYEELSRVIEKGQLPSLTLADDTPIFNVVLKEVQRIRTVAPVGLLRMNDEDDCLGGYFIPKNSIVFWNSWGFSHDPEVWGDPNTFRPERFFEPKHADKQLFIFGAGPRMCVGSNLADEEVYSACALMCQKYKWHFDNPALHKGFDDGVAQLTLRPHPFKVVLSART